MKKKKPDIKALAGAPLVSRVISSTPQQVQLEVPNAQVVVLNTPNGAIQVPMEIWDSWVKYVDTKCSEMKGEDNGNS